MEDLATDIGGWFGIAIGFLTAVGMWIAARFKWVQKQSKGIRVAVYVSCGLLIAVVLSIVTGFFT